MTKKKEIIIMLGDLIGIRFVGNKYGELVKYYIVTKLKTCPGNSVTPSYQICSCSPESGDFFTQPFSNVVRICEHNGKEVIHMKYVD